MTFLNITEIDMIIEKTRKTIDNLSVLWETILVNCLGILEFPLKTSVGNSSDKRLPT